MKETAKYIDELQFAVNLFISIDFKSVKSIESDLRIIFGKLSRLDRALLLIESSSNGETAFQKLCSINEYQCRLNGVPTFLSWGNEEINSVVNRILSESPIHKRYVDILNQKGTGDIHINLTDEDIDGITDVEGIRDLYLERRNELLTAYIQPDTSTEQEQTVKRSPIMNDKDIVSVFNAIAQLGFMEYRDGFYYWMADNILLAYLCNRISLYKDYSKQYRKGIGDLPNWTVFEGLFKAKGRKKDEWVEVNSQKLSDYQKAYMKTHDSFSPDGCNPIDDIIDKYINH